MSIEIIPLVVEALHSLEARKLASRECNASTTRGIISILIVLVGSNYLILINYISITYQFVYDDCQMPEIEHHGV